jgi:hypothetical protein
LELRLIFIVPGTACIAQFVSAVLPVSDKLSYALVRSVKEQVLEAIQRLPDDIDFLDVTEEIALLAAVHDAEQDIQRGRVISNEEMKSRIAPDR